MIKIHEAIVVEGKYDKIRISQCIDTIIIETGGFRLCKDDKKLSLIKKLAKEKGIIVITDSDSAGFFIRNYIRSAISSDRIKHVYIPEIFGKEKRKKRASKEGKLGLEGLSNEMILEALKKAKVIETIEKDKVDLVTKTDLYELGLMGKTNSKRNRQLLLKELELPDYMSTNAILEFINSIMTKTEFINLINKLKSI